MKVAITFSIAMYGLPRGTSIESAHFVLQVFRQDGCCNQYMHTNTEDGRAGDDSAEMLDVDDEDLEDKKEENADQHGVPDEDETDDDDDYVDDGWV